MSKLRETIKHTIHARKNGHSGLFTKDDFALMLNCSATMSLSKFLHGATQSDTLERVCQGVYINPLFPPEPKGLLVRLAAILHWNKFIYISLESQLSYIGRISQIPMNRLTIITTGRSGNIKTRYGVIEFIHTNASIESLNNQVYYDPELKIFRANEAQAIRDLRKSKRNVQMLTENEE
ncbi:MAG: putative transcriptional regulator of viral defense system [Phenylobacterium sp.]|jgi:predicted transcriptional regulator of viral defense system